jgi:hypothetical protein
MDAIHTGCDVTVKQGPYLYSAVDRVVHDASTANLRRTIYGILEKENENDPRNLVIYEYDDTLIRTPQDFTSWNGGWSFLGWQRMPQSKTVSKKRESNIAERLSRSMN